MWHEPALLLLEFSSLSWFSALKTQGQDFATSLIPPLPQPISQDNSELLPCSSEDAGMKIPSDILNSRHLWSEVRASSWPRRRLTMYLRGTHPSKLCPEEAAGDFLLRLKLKYQPFSLCCVSSSAWGLIKIHRMSCLGRDPLGS